NNPSQAPFKVTLAGQGFYVIINPKDVGQVYKNNTTLSFDVFIQDLMLSCGTSKEIVEKMSQTPPPYISGANDSGLNPSKNSLIRLAVDFHHTQLLPGPSSQAGPLTATFIRYISHSLQWESLSQAKKNAAHKTPDTMQTSLLRLCGKVLIEAGTKTYWGDKLWQRSPDMLETFYDLDRAMWKLLFRYPKTFSKDAVAARNTIIEILTRYYKMPREERSDSAWFTQSLETESRATGLSENDMAAAILIIYFVVNGNPYKFCFWALYHILGDPELHNAIKREINASDGKPTMEYLLNNCPLLASVLSGVLRLYTSSASMQSINSDTEISGKILRKGNRIMLPYRTFRENPGVFGHDSLEFQPMRFMKTQSLDRNVRLGTPISGLVQSHALIYIRHRSSPHQPASF
ncbi:cytochrome P450, partial [Zopfia rhizophila CBS 207.26]